MTRFLSGGNLYSIRRPAGQPALLFFILASLILAACGTQVANTDWPGLTAADNQVYVASGSGVLAVDVAEEKQLWLFPEDPQARLQFYAAPAVAEDRVIVGDYGAAGGLFSPSVRVSIYALNADNGQVAWVVSDVAKDRIIAPPLQVEEMVFVGTADNVLLALDAGSGQLRWRFDTGHSIWGQPTYDDGVLFVSSLDKEVYALDADSGREIWRHTFAGAVASKPIVDDGLVYVSSFDKRLHALDRETGNEEWSAEAGDWVWAAPVLNGDLVYYVDVSGNVYAVEAASGTRVWMQNIGGLVRATPLLVDGVLYVASAGDVNVNEAERQGALIALDDEDGRELWRKTTSAPLYTTPVAVNDTIVVALISQDALLLVFDQKDGSQRWSFRPALE